MYIVHGASTVHGKVTKVIISYQLQYLITIVFLPRSFSLKFYLNIFLIINKYFTAVTNYVNKYFSITTLVIILYNMYIIWKKCMYAYK